MRLRWLSFQAVVVVALAAWRLASPATLDAAPAGGCGKMYCVGPESNCSEGSSRCDECAGWVCFAAAVPCGANNYAVYCDEPM